MANPPNAISPSAIDKNMAMWDKLIGVTGDDAAAAPAGGQTAAAGQAAPPPNSGPTLAPAPDASKLTPSAQKILSLGPQAAVDASGLPSVQGYLSMGIRERDDLMKSLNPDQKARLQQMLGADMHRQIGQLPPDVQQQIADMAQQRTANGQKVVDELDPGGKANPEYYVAFAAARIGVQQSTQAAVSTRGVPGGTLSPDQSLQQQRIYNHLAETALAYQNTGLSTVLPFPQ
jgi:hypothetical protein